MPARSLHKARAPLGRSMFSAVTLFAAAAGVVAVTGEGDATVVGTSRPGPGREYGAAQRLGNGHVRSYIVRKNGNGAPIEIGVAFTEAVMDSLPAAPAPMKDHDKGHAADEKPGHVMGTELLLDLPAHHGTQYKFVQVGWNPAGHEPPGVYDLPHFDFHFYNISKAERDLIDPSNPQYAANARNAPAGQHAREFFINPAVALNLPAEALAVPKMGVHWLNAKSPELQGMVGNPSGARPFTATYIQGAWNGQFIFEEPMITRAHIMAKRTATDSAVRDEIIPITAAVKASPAGYYPSAYRILYDAASKEYRIALTQLGYRE